MGLYSFGLTSEKGILIFKTDNVFHDNLASCPCFRKLRLVRPLSFTLTIIVCTSIVLVLLVLNGGGESLFDLRLWVGIRLWRSYSKFVEVRR